MVKQILVKDFDHAVSYILSKLLAKVWDPKCGTPVSLVPRLFIALGKESGEMRIQFWFSLNVCDVL